MAVRQLQCPTHRTALPKVENPTDIWADLRLLAPQMQQLVHDAPLMRVHRGEVKLDMTLLKRIEADAQTKEWLQRFRHSLPAVNVDEVDSPHVERREEAIGEHKRKREHESEADVGADLATPIEMMQVPYGASGGDCLTFYDTTTRKLTRQYMRVPRVAYEGMAMSYVRPKDTQTVMIVDGDDFKTGMNTKAQHALRLKVHRTGCQDKRCCVLGCNDDRVFSLFKNAAEKELHHEYEQHWRKSRRYALKVHGRELRQKH